MKEQIIFHIPHDGNEFPEELMESVVVPHADFYEYHNKMRDTDSSYFVPDIDNSTVIKFEVSRLLCDVERFIGEEEIMEKYGMGFCYEKVFDKTVIKKITDSIKEKTYALYKAHHDKVDRIIENIEAPIILVDLHSFSKEIIVHCDIEKELPDVCIGFDDYIKQSQVKKIVSAFENQGFSVALNYPYGGSFVPNSILSGVYKRELTSFMIEVNKNSYIKNNMTDALTIKKIQTSIYNALTQIKKISPRT